MLKTFKQKISQRALKHQIEKIRRKRKKEKKYFPTTIEGSKPETTEQKLARLSREARRIKANRKI